MGDPGKILVTGANGFLGEPLLRALAERQISAVGAVRSPDSVRSALPGTTYVSVGDIDEKTRWEAALQDVAVVIHCAARVHVMNDTAGDPLQLFRTVNRDGTLNLARQAAAAGVRRFVFISTIKVNGEYTDHRSAFGADDAPAPEDPYGISKMEAEQGLQRLSKETGMEVVIIRPPLVYGPGVKGNFASMARFVRKGLPLPLGAVHNQRSLVSLDNLVDLIITCIEHPGAANQVFLAGDGEDLSTTELLRRIGKAMGKPARLIPVPAGLIILGATLLGKQPVAQRLLGSLQVDIAKACELLGWAPPVGVDEGLRRCFTRSDRS